MGYVLAFTVVFIELYLALGGITAAGAGDPSVDAEQYTDSVCTVSSLAVEERTHIPLFVALVSCGREDAHPAVFVALHSAPRCALHSTAVVPPLILGVLMVQAPAPPSGSSLRWSTSGASASR